MKNELLQSLNYAKSEGLIQMYFDNKFGDQIQDSDFA
jgi:hypothetical protein